MNLGMKPGRVHSKDAPIEKANSILMKKSIYRQISSRPFLPPPRLPCYTRVEAV
jgi:hypothetical protein